MPTCEYCDQLIEAGASSCPFCFAPLDPSAHSDASQPQAPDGPPQHAPSPPAAGAPPAPQQAPPPPPAPPPQAAPDQGAGVGDILQSLQNGDVGGVAQGLQNMASSGQLDVGKLASDLGVGGGGAGKELDLGSVAQALASGGSGASNVLSALGNQGGGLGSLLASAKGALGGTGGMAAGGAALAVGAGLLANKAGGSGGLSDMLGSLFGGAGGGGPAGQADSVVGGEQAHTSAEGAQLAQIAQQLPPPSVEQLREGENVLARWSETEWRAAKIGWVDGAQARVTFESGLEKWCELSDMRFPPVEGMAPPPPPQAPPSALPAVGSTVQAEVGANLYAPAQVLETDELGHRIRIRYENNYECWHDADKILKY